MRLLYRYMVGTSIGTFGRAFVGAFIVLALVGTSFAGPVQAGGVEVDCARVLKSENLMVLMAFGQSNSANFGLPAIEAGPGVFSFNKGKCFKAVDPLPGANGSGGSIWTRFGKRLIEADKFDKVLIVSFGHGGTRADEWTKGGRVYHKLQRTLRDVLASGLPVTHIFWLQGESDAFAGTSRESYMKSVGKVVDTIRIAGIEAPFYISQSTLCLDYAGRNEVRRAQKLLVKNREGVFAGPDTDILGREFRHDRCHLNAGGLENAAILWLESTGLL